jgi:ribosomal protein S25
MTDFLDEKRREISERLTELEPVVDEFHRLEAAAAALAGAVGSVASEAAGAVVRHRGRRRRRRSARHRAAATATAPREPDATAAKPGPAKAKTAKAKAARKPAARSAKRRAGRPKGSGTRAAQALALVQGQPGITTPELAAKMGIAANYLYRVLPGLQKEGKIRKEGRGWQAKAA